jgi:hypothetical protein
MRASVEPRRRCSRTKRSSLTRSCRARGSRGQVDDRLEGQYKLWSWPLKTVWMR